ncbi:MAG: nuclear transport factor 2 family protein [Chloroflexota bacterium]
MAATTTDLQSAVRALDAAFIRHGNAQDAAALTRAFYAEDAVLLPPGAARVSGADAIQAFWAAFIAAGAADISIETTNIWEAGDLGYGIGTYACTQPAPDGGRVHDTGKYLVVYRRQADGSWKAVADQFNSDLPSA